MCPQAIFLQDLSQNNTLLESVSLHEDSLTNFVSTSCGWKAN